MEKIAFEQEYKNFKITAFYGDSSDSRIEITKDGKEYRTFLYPSYKIFNLAAHFEDVVEGELRNSSVGYKIAGSDGLGGCIVPQDIKKY